MIAFVIVSTYVIMIMRCDVMTVLVLLFVSQCGLSSHKTCLRNLRWECGRLKRRSSSRHSHPDPPPMIAQKGLPDQVPYVVKKCIEQIDADGLQVKVALSLRSDLGFTDD